MSDIDNDALTQADAALRRLNLEMGAAECHGVVTGWLCAAPTLTRESWRRYLLEEADGGDALAKEAADTLDALRQAAVVQLSDPLLGFQPLLPGDDVPLIERVDALGEWCQGFLLGISLGGIKDIGKLPEESREAVQDLVQMARAGSYDVEGSDEDEEAYVELVEYVRTVVLLVNEELNPSKAPPQMDHTLH